MNPALISGTVRVVAFTAALLLLTMLVVTRSQAAFTATTSNPTSSFSAGNLDLSDDDADQALFLATEMVPGSSVEACINVTYSGDVTPAPVKVYGTSSGALAPYLDLEIETGTGSTGSNCAGFTGASSIYTGTLADFTGSHTGWTDGLAGFTATTEPQTVSFRFTATVQDDDAAQGLDANAAFTWETRVGTGA